MSSCELRRDRVASRTKVAMSRCMPCCRVSTALAQIRMRSHKLPLPSPSQLQGGTRRGRGYPISISVRVIDGIRSAWMMVGQTSASRDSTHPKQEAGRDAKQSARRAKPLNGGFANLSALAARTFSQLRALVRQRRKARIRATSAVAAERFESMASM
jgi:hypothetical protein